jgi:cell division transport system permease protein
MGKSSGEQSMGSIPIKEVELSFNSSFLTEYWQEAYDLPQESRISFIWNIISRTWKVLASEPISTLSSYVIVSSSLFMFSLFLLFDYNIGRLLAQVGTSNEGMVYFSSSAGEEEMHNVHKTLAEIGLTGSTNFISKEDALDLFRKDFGDDAVILKGLDENPLPHAIEFNIREEFDLNESISLIKDHLAEFAIVDEITLGAPWADTAERFRQGLKKMSFAVFVIVLAVVIFIVANTVKLMLLSQKEEIDIMQLVGAPRNLVIVPYVLGGLLQGFWGGITALAICYVLFASFLEPLNSYLVVGVSYEVFSFLGILYSLLVVAVGVSLGVIGSYLALLKWTE